VPFHPLSPRSGRHPLRERSDQLPLKPLQRLTPPEPKATPPYTVTLAPGSASLWNWMFIAVKTLA
jgi:hypothetical protein